MLTYAPLRRVLLDERLIGAVREVLGGPPAYWGESSVVIGSYGGARAWHTDAYATPVTSGTDYSMIRCGLYLQDIKSYSGGLAVRPKSHLYTERFENIRGIDHVLKFARTRCALVASRPGDLVIWDMRTLHAGEVVRSRLVLSFGLPLSIQGRLPQALALPEERSRVVMFPTFGLPGPDLDSYLEYQRSREYTHAIWKASQFGTDVWNEAAAAGLRLIRPIPEYGMTAGEDVAQPGEQTPA